MNARPLRTTAGGAQKAALAAAPPPDEGGFETIADLVAELIASTELLPADRLAAVRGRAGTGTLAQAIVDEGHAQSEGVARALARRHGFPFVDLAETRISPNAIEAIALRTLQRVVAVPVALVGDRLRVAVADPANIHGIDELRVASRYPVDVCVASREDILTEISRVARQTEVLETQTAIEELQVDDEGEEALEVDDGVSDAPLVRLVNSIIMQAAGDGASDIHFEAQEDALSVRTRVDGVLTETQRIPKRMAAGVTTRLKVLAKLDIAERREAAGRPHLAERPLGRSDARHPRRSAPDRRGRAGRDAPDRQVAHDADARVARSLGDDAGDALHADPQAHRRPARHGPDGLGQVDDALCRARRDQPPERQDHHGRGPGRVPPGRDQPDPDQPQGRAHLRGRRCARSCARTPT